MFRILLVLVEIAALVMLLRTSFAQYMLKDVQRSVTEIFTDISYGFEQTQLEDLRQSLAPQMVLMRDFQKDYILEITSSKANLKHFHIAYCDKKNINPYVNGSNLNIVCHAIVKAKLVETENIKRS